MSMGMSCSTFLRVGATCSLLALLAGAPGLPAAEPEKRAVAGAARLIGTTVQTGRRGATGIDGKRGLVDLAHAAMGTSFVDRVSMASLAGPLASGAEELRRAAGGIAAAPWGGTLRESWTPYDDAKGKEAVLDVVDGKPLMGQAVPTPAGLSWSWAYEHHLASVSMSWSLEEGVVTLEQARAALQPLAMALHQGVVAGGLGNLIDTPAPALQGKPPCDAALRAFGLDPNQPTKMRYDFQDLRGQFDAAIERFNHEGSQQAFSSDNLMGTVPALSWLAHQGGTMNVVSKRFVFASDADRERWQRARTRHLPDTDAGIGTERALHSAIYEMSVREGRKLSPGDVFYLALKQRGGHVRDAMLLAHNTLRSLARVNDNELTDVSQDIGFIERHLEQSLVELHPLANAGNWYHLFGTAYFEMQARGEWGPNTLAQLTVDGLGDLMFDKLAQMAQALKRDPGLELPQTRTAVSMLANEVEQFYRKHRTGQADDPVKYCYNVFGAQLGAWLYREKLRAPGAEPPPLPPTQRMTILGPVPATMTGEKIVISLSPLHLRWEGNGYQMTLDQRTGQITGFYPLKLVPFFEPDTGTWGMLWVDQLRQPYTLRMEASADGHAHLLTTQPEGTRVHALPLRQGQRFRIDVAPDRLPSEISVDGGDQVAPMALAGRAEGALGASAATTMATPIEATDDDLALAQREYDEAFESYTKLVTTGGAGDVTAALARYRQAYERLQRVNAERAPR